MNKYLGLLRWSLNYQDGTTSNAQPMDPERRKWLMEAIESQIIDPVEQMKNIIDILDLEPPINDTDIKLIEFYSKKNDTLLELISYVDNFDLALDFHKLKGTEKLLSLLNKTKNEDVKINILELLSILTQNHPKLQAALIDLGGLDTLLALLSDKDISSKQRSKVIGALGSLVRSNKLIATKFLVDQKALPIIFDIIKQNKGYKSQAVVVVSISDDEKEMSRRRILRKSLFLIKYFVDEIEEIRKPIQINFSNLLKSIQDKEVDIDAKELSKQIYNIISTV